MGWTSLELCAGAGGQALGLERAGFEPAALIDHHEPACHTLTANRPLWSVVHGDLRQTDFRAYRGVTLVAGGVPCPPYSVSGKRQGQHDARDLFPEALRAVQETEPQAVMLENVHGLSESNFRPLLEALIDRLRALGYVCDWRVLNCREFGVAQNRRRTIIVALRSAACAKRFRWPEPCAMHVTVGMAIGCLMAEGGWAGCGSWARLAHDVAPCLCASRGGPSLCPSGTRQRWWKMGVDPCALATGPPQATHNGAVRLTLRMTGVLQGFPADWVFCGSMTAAYRQVANALPPQLAEAVGRSIATALG